MFRRFAAFISVLVTALMILTVQAQDQPFDIGDEVTVLGEARVLMIYSEPATSSSIVEATISGFTMTIIDGPEENDAGIWWEIRSPSGSAGWVLYLVNDVPTIGLAGGNQAFTETSSTLTAGGRAIIITGGFVLMYEEPDINSSALEALISNFEVVLIEGPEVVDEQRWWYIESPSDQQGWLQENINGETVLYTEAELAVPTVTPTPIPTATPVPVIRLNGRVSTTRLNIRTGPGPEYEQVTQLSDGDQITVIGRNDAGTWVQLDAQDQRWINARYAVISGNISELPVTFAEIGDWGAAGQPTGARARATTVLRLRGGPGSNYRQLENPDTLQVGAIADIVGRTSDNVWYQVNVNNRSAWILASGTALTGHVNASIPVTSD